MAGAGDKDLFTWPPVLWLGKMKHPMPGEEMQGGTEFEEPGNREGDGFTQEAT